MKIIDLKENLTYLWNEENKNLTVIENGCNIFTISDCVSLTQAINIFKLIMK